MTRPENMTIKQYRLIRQALDATIDRGNTERDEQLLAFIEATLRDALGQNHGVWRWRVAGKTWFAYLGRRYGWVDCGREQLMQSGDVMIGEFQTLEEAHTAVRSATRERESTHAKTHAAEE